MGDIGGDSLSGGAGDDTLIGGANSDTLIGGADADELTGGAASDRFDYNAPTDGGDTITDFTHGAGADVIAIGDLLVGFDVGEDLVADGFVQVIDSGGKSAVQVDADGSAGVTFGFDTLVTLSNVNFGDVTATGLVADGNIVAEP
jgi:Ca2+-binding RTX toxin-like protein